MIGKEATHKQTGESLVILSGPTMAGARGIVLICATNQKSVTPVLRELKTIGILDLAMSSTEIEEIRVEAQSSAAPE